MWFLKRDEVPIRSFLERVVDERDRQYDMRFRAAEIAVNAALAAQEKAVAAAFLASEKAIVKAEEAQKDYNIRSNEFRGQLDDQAKTLMPRQESSVLFKGIEDKVLLIQNTYDGKLETIHVNAEKNTEAFTKELITIRLDVARLLPIETFETRHIELQRQVNELRESRSEISGSKITSREISSYAIGFAGVIIAIISALILYFK